MDGNEFDEGYFAYKQMWKLLDDSRENGEWDQLPRVIVLSCAKKTGRLGEIISRMKERILEFKKKKGNDADLKKEIWDLCKEFNHLHEEITLILGPEMLKDYSRNLRRAKKH